MAMRILVTLLIVFFTIASASRCNTMPDGTNCCGLQVAIFNPYIFEAFATTNGYFNDENLTVCFYKSTSSVAIFNLLAAGTVDLSLGVVDNAVWRRLNFGTNFTTVASEEGARGFYLLGNSRVLGGQNSVSALSGKNIVVDSVDSGYITGLIKTLSDYGVTNYTFIPFGSNRLGIVQQGWVVSNGINYTIAATMQNAIAPYLVSYPVVNLAIQVEHFCPTEGIVYNAYSKWLDNSTNLDDLTKYLRALLRSTQYIEDPANVVPVKAWIAKNIANNDSGIVELQYDDYVNNPASGISPFLTPRKTGLRNLIDTRIEMGMSPYPADESIDSMLTDKPGGFVDLRALKAAQASLGLPNTYDTNPGTYGCPVKNTGVIAPVPPQFTCTVSYQISSQPPSWPTGLSAQISTTVSNTSALLVNGAQGWNVSFSGTFAITSSWNTGSVTTKSSGNINAFAITNANYNGNQAPSFGFNGATTNPAPENNICNFRINGILCQIQTPTTMQEFC